MSENVKNKLLTSGLKVGLVGGLVGGAAVGSLTTLGVLKVVNKVRELAAGRAQRAAEKAAAKASEEEAAAAKKQEEKAARAARMSERLNSTFARLGLKLRAEKTPAAAVADAGAAGQAATKPDGTK